VPDDTLTCPNCQSPVHPDWFFCTHCGSRRERIAATSSSEPVCGHCGAAIQSSGAYCWKCGLPLMTGRQSYTPAPPVTEPPPRPSSGAAVTIPTPTRPAAGAAARPAQRGPARRGRPFGVAVLLVGTVLLVVSLFVGWYVVSETSTDTVGTNTFTVNESETLYLFNAQTLSFSCQGSSSCFASGTTSGTYSQGSLTGAATLYDVVSGLILCAVLLGGIATFMCFRGGRRSLGWAKVLVVVALALVVFSPTILALGQPSALSSQGTHPGGSSAATSFFGSCSGSECGPSVAPGVPISGSWGPSIGWYLSLAAFVPLLVGLFMIPGPRRFASGPLTPEMFE